jgi:hypothetical protein
LIFLHIPKTGGSTLASILNRRFADNDVWKFFGNEIEKLEERLETKSDVDRLKLLEGHIHFGWHKYFDKPAKYITVLRNPVDRVVSHYYHVRRDSNNYLHKEVVERNISLHDYVLSDLSWELDNAQTRQISGLIEVPVGQCKRSMLDLALKNLQDKFLLVGLTERYNETLLLLHKLMGWKGIPFQKALNVGYNKPRHLHLDDAVVKDIARKNSLDMELYNGVATVFEERVRAAGITRRMLKRLELANFLVTILSKTYRGLIGNRN